MKVLNIGIYILPGVRKAFFKDVTFQLKLEAQVAVSLTKGGRMSILGGKNSVMNT